MALDYKCKISVYSHHYELECKKNNDLCISKEFSDSLVTNIDKVFLNKRNKIIHFDNNDGVFLKILKYSSGRKDSLIISGFTPNKNENELKQINANLFYIFKELKTCY